VACAALRILDNLGLPDLTMRRLAAELDVQPSALYHHFPNKQTMLAELADRIVATHGLSPEDVPEDWRDALRAESAALRDGLLAYRDGAEVVSSTLALGLGADAPLHRLAGVIGRGGFDDSTAARASSVLVHFVLGHVSHEQQRMQYDSLGALSPELKSRGLDDDQAASFAFGVDLLVGGLERSRSRT